MVPDKLPISVVLLTRNEERNIRACLQSCDFAEEFIVVDDGSSDHTREIAQEMGAQVFQRSLKGDWGAQKRFGIAQASHPWILLIDADERVTSQLRESIQRVMADTDEQNAYLIQRENHFFSGEATHGILRPDWVLRFLPKEGSSVTGQVHEKVTTPFPLKRLKGCFRHYPYDSWDSYFRKFDKYTKLAAEKYLAEGRSCHFVTDILLRPLWAFFKVYFINRGFLDGKLGFIFSVNHYFYTMAKYVRYYYLKNYGGKI